PRAAGMIHIRKCGGRFRLWRISLLAAGRGGGCRNRTHSVVPPCGACRERLLPIPQLVSLNRHVPRHRVITDVAIGAISIAAVVAVIVAIDDRVPREMW